MDRRWPRVYRRSNVGLVSYTCAIETAFSGRRDGQGRVTVGYNTGFKITNNILYHYKPKMSWLRHHMQTFSALLAICAGNSPVNGEFPATLMFSLICAWINGWINNGEAGDLRRHLAHYDVTVMMSLWRCVAMSEVIVPSGNKPEQSCKRSYRTELQTSTAWGRSYYI